MSETISEWRECSQCCLSLPASNMEEHLRDGHNIDNYKKIPFIKNGVFFAKVCTIEAIGIKHADTLLKNHKVFVNPDTMSICKFQRNQSIIMNNTIILEVFKSELLPLGSVAVSEVLYKNMFENGSKLASLDAPVLDDVVPAWVCHVTMSCQHYIDKTSHFLKSHLLYKYKKYIFENESFVINCFGTSITVTVHSITSMRTFKVKKTDDISTALSSLSLNQNHSEKKFYFVFESTKFVQLPEKKWDKLKLNHIKGMDKLKNELMCGMRRYYLRDSTEFYYRCCMIVGPQGSAKTSLVEAIAYHYGLPIITPKSSDVFSENIKEFENKISTFKDKVSKTGPCILFLDNLDLLFPIKTITNHARGRYIAGHFNKVIKNLGYTRCFVIAATKNLDSIHDEFKCFDWTLEIEMPSSLDRLDIMVELLDHHNIEHGFTNDEIKKVTDIAHGFTGFDLNGVCSTMKMKNRSRKVTIDELLSLVHKSVPSILKDVAIESPNVSWEDVGGQEKLKEILKWSIEKPIEDPSQFKDNVIKGILLYGPPGCSKTMIVKALATECGLNFLWIQGSQLHGKYVGETEQAIKRLFYRARCAAPSVIFFDEIDVFAPRRKSCGSDAAGVADRCASLLMTEMDGILGLKNVFIIAATNRPDRIDPALLRSGRFDTRVYVPLPDFNTRLKILEVLCRKGSVDDDVDISLLATQTEGFSCAGVASLYESAGTEAIAENNNVMKIKMKHFITAVDDLLPHIDRWIKDWYDKFQ